jgi:subtilase family serine protease
VGSKIIHRGIDGFRISRIDSYFGPQLSSARERHLVAGLVTQGAASLRPSGARPELKGAVLSPFSGRSRVLRTALIAAAAVALAGGSAASATASVHAGASAHTAQAHVRRVCAITHRAGIMSCMALIRTDVRQRSAASMGLHAPSGVGYGPSSLQSAYNLPSSTAGTGKIVAVVDAFNDPNAVSDLAVYRSSWGLAACNTSTGAGCLTVVNQNGKASPLPRNSGSTGWATEESLDVDMVSAICPLCHIYLVEANSPSTKSLGTAVNSAVSLGAGFVSNSYGGSQGANDPNFDNLYYKHAGVAVVASAGDSGYGVSYPAASQYVTSVGGTSLVKATGTARGWAETVWSGTGSGCATKSEAKPSWQTDTGCKHRTDNDVAAVADPNTGVAIYDTYDQGGWLEVGGTSVSSPIIASVFALAGTPAAGTFPSSYPYAHTSALNDVIAGSNGVCTKPYLCTGEVGYDGPTGWGTPNGTTAFTG